MVFRVELVTTLEEGQQPLDEIDVERMINGEIDWSERIVSVRAEKLEEARTEDVPRYIGPAP
jgi:hypothetical protein